YIFNDLADAGYLVAAVQPLAYEWGADTDGGNWGQRGVDFTILLDATTATAQDFLALPLFPTEPFGLSTALPENLVNIQGSSEPDSWQGTTASERFYGQSGDDTLWGDAGHDVLLGGDGDDHLVGGEGSDRLEGGDGNDYLIGFNIATDTDTDIPDPDLDTPVSDTSDLDTSESGASDLDAPEVLDTPELDMLEALDTSGSDLSASEVDPIESDIAEMDISASESDPTESDISASEVEPIEMDISASEVEPIEMDLSASEVEPTESDIAEPDLSASESDADAETPGEDTISQVTADSDSDLAITDETLVDTHDDSAVLDEILTGTNEADILVGGLGQDTFVLGDATQPYYNAAGRDDYAWIQDFQPADDTLVLHGSANRYSTAIANGHTELWLRPTGDHAAELIAYFAQTPNIQLYGDSVQYV
ncbi:MAG: hypothetical protein F6K30_25740, partial [Cyanothece sp. SIO2G6]|nr:hypothetical protein [Cyanothece sp. SIO2G6]